MVKARYLFLLITFSGFIISSSSCECLLELSVIHFSDFHARFEPTTRDSGHCKNDKCIGGFSRLYATIMTLRKKKPKSILLNAGDNFELTPWYSAHRWNVFQYFLNKLPIDAYALGNHEFDAKIEGLIPFLQHLNSPVLGANVDLLKEPTLNDLIKKSVVIERNGLKIGIIGAIWSKTSQFQNTGNLFFMDESKCVNDEAERLINEEGVFTNIVLSHSGYDIDQEIARKATSKISLVVGAHSHILLYTGEKAPGYDLPAGPYPTVVKSLQGKTVLVVHASQNTKYLGNISVFYNSSGDIERWSGAPIFLNTSVRQDEKINQELEIWKQPVECYRSTEILGSTLVRLEQLPCSIRECLIGNFVTDAMVLGYTKSPEPGSWTNGSIAVINGRGLRAGIDIGNITFDDIFTIFPFENTFDLAEIEGKRLKEIFEFSVSKKNINLLQVSGVKIIFNLSKPKGKRVTSLLLRSREGDIPTYEKMIENKKYKIIIPSFLAAGGFDFDLFKTHLKNRKTGNLDTSFLIDYVTHKSPILQEIEGRIQILT